MIVKRKKQLRSGYTTGACAAAATLGAARMLKQQQMVDTVELELPAGVTARFKLGGQHFSPEQAGCFVVKDAGDDPDVTDGVEVHALVEKNDAGSLEIRGGVGVGTVTKPGLPVAVGQPAINPVPRQMIEAAVRSVYGDDAIRVTISIPDGEERSKRTLNERLGIVGGLSILGTTGIVRPISHRAWTDTIDVAIDVALAGVGDAVVLVTGRTSERVAQDYFDLPGESFVMMGDHVGYALDACRRKQVPRIIVAAQFAKLLKVACGHRQTHVSSSRLDLAALAGWYRNAGLDASVAEKIECANTAREVLTTALQPAVLGDLVARKARSFMSEWAGGRDVEIVLVGYDNEVFAEYQSDMEKGREQ